MGKRCALLIMVMVLVTACADQRPTAGRPASLVTGVVAAGPVFPHARPGMPATRPVQGADVEALRASRVVAAAHTDHAGRYELRLHPGTYVIRVRSHEYLSKEKRATVTLAKGQKRTVNLILDTGIR